jgi:carbamoyl-phosphate synthase large subunit
MPRRDDLKSILIIGSGPIVIGQACEFDYSGTQAVKALREEGYRTVLVNSNPATIMTDPGLSDRTYVEPLTPEFVEKIIARERPDAILPTLGGQTGLNLAIRLHERGTLSRYGVEMIGADAGVIRKAEERHLFKEAMERIGLDLPKSGTAHDLGEAEALLAQVGLPCVIRPSFTLGGQGGGIAYNVEEFRAIVRRGLQLSMSGEVLVEEGVLGWKEFELEVMRDRKDNVVIICSIENVDPMGVHTGDSITVAPAQTLTDKEYQRMRDASIAIMREIGVECGGSNIQFAVHPETGRMVVIEMNPRVSRSSALASKATGFPIAKMAAKLAVGYTLDEIPNDITKKTPACFEPTIDYCVVKVPRFNFEKFREADPTLTTSMKSVGEAMAIGRTFPEALQKALRSLESGRFGLGADRAEARESREPAVLREKLVIPNPERIFYLRHAFLSGLGIEEVHRLTRIDRWFLHQIRDTIELGERVRERGSLERVGPELLLEAKRWGYSDHQIAALTGSGEEAVRKARLAAGIVPAYKSVDTCAGEFEAFTPYYYSTYDPGESELRATGKKRIVVLGSGPNRIGQGIEFDYACVHASYALRELGYETVMINSNPETVSTDYDTSDVLLFEPLTREDVLNACDALRPHGVIVQFGGQTPLNLAKPLAAAGVPILGTSPESIDRAEDRDLFQALIARLRLTQPANGVATNEAEALEAARRIGYPVLVRPSFVLGGRAMEIVYDDEALVRWMRVAVAASPDRPVLVDKFLEDATEVDVDALADGERVVLGAIMEHIEEAGIHSGDSSCTIPPPTLSPRIKDEIRRYTHALAKELDVRGLMNVQYAVKNDVLYVLEVNPRASRTAPYVSKAVGVLLAKAAAKVMAGVSLEEQGIVEEATPAHVAVKSPVFPFNRFPGCDIILGPEMRSTGEVMGIDAEFGAAFAKAQIAAHQAFPASGRVFLSVKDADKRAIIGIARQLGELGFTLVATEGTHRVLKRSGLEVDLIHKISGGRPNVLDVLTNREIALVINTPSGKGPRSDEARIRGMTVLQGIPCITTLSGAAAAVAGIEALQKGTWSVRSLQEYFEAAVAR